MRKLVLLFVLCTCLFMSAMADNLLYMTKSQAKQAAKFLQKQKYVLLYCSCCSDGNDYKTYVKLKSVSYRYTGHQEYYEVLVKGVDSNGNKVSEHIDLAYTYFQANEYADCVGLALEFYCLPCVEQVEWECPEF